MSQILANNVIQSLANEPPLYSSEEFLIAIARWLNGNELCDALDLGRPGLYHWALALSQCLFIATTSYINRSIPFLDRRKIRVSALQAIYYSYQADCLDAPRDLLAYDCRRQDWSGTGNIL